MTDFETNEATPTDSADSPGPAPGNLSIGAVLAELQDEFPDVSISKIRFLESRGLVEPYRAASGYRRFGDDDVERLRWILTMQRDHFLPLRVIKERLDAGVHQTPAEPEPTGSGAAVPRLEALPRTPTARFAARGPATERLDPSDLQRMAGLNHEQLRDLVNFGIVTETKTDQGVRYEREELAVAKAAGAFLRRGIEARHLKAFRVAAEREASTLEQIIVPLTHQNAADATARAREVADDLIDHGNTIREAIIVKTLRPGLGFDDD